MGWAANAALSDRRSASRLAEAESLRADDLEAAVTERTLELKDANERLQQEAAERAHAEETLRQMHKMEADRKRVVSGQSVSVRVDLVGIRIIHKIIQ